MYNSISALYFSQLVDCHPPNLTNIINTIKHRPFNLTLKNSAALRPADIKHSVIKFYAGPEGGSASLSTNSNQQDYTYSMLDAFVPLPGDENAQCRCKRGAQVSYLLAEFNFHVCTPHCYRRANRVREGRKDPKVSREKEA